jgi:hypothetical protein
LNDIKEIINEIEKILEEGKDGWERIQLDKNFNPS